MCLCKLVMTHDSLLIVRFVFFPTLTVVGLPVLRKPRVAFQFTICLEKGPPSPLMLPSPFPKLLLWSSAGGVTPQAEKRWPVPRRGWRTARLVLFRHKKRPVTTTGRFCIGRVGDRAGRVSSTVYHGVHLGQSGAAVQGAGDAECPCFLQKGGLNEKSPVSF